MSAEATTKIVVQHFWNKFVAWGSLNVADGLFTPNGLSTTLAKLVSAISRSRVVPLS